jgi:nitrogenase molybdenum-iron protein beta chain
MPGVIPIVHASMGCGGNLSGANSFGAGYWGAGYCGGGSIPTSAITETEIVFGGNDRLREEIESTLELIDGQLYIVATGCMTEMIGDDTKGVTSDFAGEGKPVIAVSTPSFKGDSYAGYEIALNGIFNDYLKHTEKKNEKLVNIFGIVPAYDPFFRGDLEEMARLIRALGLEANTFFTPDQTFENVKSASSAALNIVFSRVWGISFAEEFEKTHGTPYWATDLPVGPEATDEFLLRMAEVAKVPKQTAKNVIERENDVYYGYFERTADVFCDSDFKFYAVTVTNSNYAIPIARYAHSELGWAVLDSFVTDQLREGQKDALLGAHESSELPGDLLFETDTSRIAAAIRQRHPQNRGERYFNGHDPLFILGSSLEKATAFKQGASQLSISFPAFNRMIVDRGYAGYRGGLHLFEDIVGSLVFPKG